MARTTNMTLDDLVRQLQSAHGNGLRSVVLYGSAAAGDFVGGHSDQNVLVVVEQLDLAVLQKLSATTQAWMESGNPPPLTLTFAEWQRSSDIFPMEYADMIERHRVLHGVSPFDGVRVEPHELRLQVEQEAMGKLLKLRTGVMMAGHDAAAQQRLLKDSLSAIMVVFRGVLRLHGIVPMREHREVALAIGRLAAFDVKPLEQVILMVHTNHVPTAPDVEKIMQGYVAGMEALVSHLDQFSPPIRAA